MKDIVANNDEKKKNITLKDTVIVECWHDTRALLIY